LSAVPFAADDWPCDPRPFYSDAQWQVECLRSATAVEQVEACIERGFDVFSTCATAPPDQDTPGIDVVRTLERHGVAFTGATSEFYEPSRVAMKRACGRRGDRRARLRAGPRAGRRRARPLVPFLSAVRQALQQLFERRSLAPLAGGVARGLVRQARKIMRRHGAALIEEFIEGTEVTVLVAENPDDPARPKTYTPIQYRFPEGESFKHASLKWVDYAEHGGFSSRRRRIACAFATLPRGSSSLSAARASAAAICASMRTARRSCSRSIRTAASTIRRPTRAAPISVCCTIPKVTRLHAPARTRRVGAAPCDWRPAGERGMIVADQSP
jgi:hypothetical protein